MSNNQMPAWFQQWSQSHDQKIDRLEHKIDILEERTKVLETHILYGIDILERSFPGSISDERKKEYQQKVKACHDRINHLIAEGVKSIPLTQLKVLDVVTEMIKSPTRYPEVPKNLKNHIFEESWIDTWSQRNFPQDKTGLCIVQKEWFNNYGDLFKGIKSKTNYICGLRSHHSKKINEITRGIFNWHSFGQLYYPDDVSFKNLFWFLEEMYFTHHFMHQDSIDGSRWILDENGKQKLYRLNQAEINRKRLEELFQQPWLNKLPA